MKRILFFVLTATALLLSSCGAGVSYVADQVRNEMESQLESQLGVDVVVGEIILVHAGGNKYESVVDVWAEGESAQFTLDVTWDGKYYQAVWEPIN